MRSEKPDLTPDSPLIKQMSQFGSAYLLESDNGYTGLHKLCNAPTKGQLDPKWQDVRDIIFDLDAQDGLKEAIDQRQGFFSKTALHVCLARNPPVDIVSALLKASPESVMSSSKLKNICRKETIKAEAQPVDEAMDTSSKSSLECGNHRNMFYDLPLHCACKFGASDEVIQLLINADPQSIAIPDNNKCTPLHRAFSPEFRKKYFNMISPRTTEMLMAEGVITSRDKNGNTPLYYITKFASTIDPGKSTMKNLSSKEISEYVSGRKDVDRIMQLGLEALEAEIYLSHKNSSSDHVCFTLMNELNNLTLPPWLLCRVLLAPNVRNVLDVISVQRISTFILLLDLAVSISLAILFIHASSASLNDRSVTVNGNARIESLPYLYIGVAYMLIREIIRLCGASSRLFWHQTEFWNVFHAFKIAVISASIILMHSGQGDYISVRVLFMLTSVVVWLAVIFIIKSVNVPFSIFIAGIIDIMKHSTSFVFIAFSLLCTSAHIVQLDSQDECPFSAECEYTSCSFWGSFLLIYTRVLGGEGFCVSQASTSSFNQFTFSIVAVTRLILAVLLINVLIKSATKAFDGQTNRDGVNSFWLQRFHFASEICFIQNFVGKWTKKCEIISLGTNSWNYLYSNLASNGSNGFTERLRCYICSLISFCLISLWVVMGVASFGLLLPREAREWLLYALQGTSDIDVVEALAFEDKSDFLTKLEDTAGNHRDQMLSIERLILSLSKDQC